MYPPLCLDRSDSFRATFKTEFKEEKGEILSCPGCGLELEVKKINCGGGCVSLQELTIEGEDWGE